MRTNPELKAERVVKIWQRLEAEHGKLRGYDEDGPRKRIEKELQSLTRDIKPIPSSASVCGSFRSSSIFPAAWSGCSRSAILIAHSN